MLTELSQIGLKRSPNKGSFFLHGKEKQVENKSDTFLASFDYTHGNIPVLIVGRRGKEKEIDIINAFQGDEAKELYKRLTEKRVSV